MKIKFSGNARFLQMPATHTLSPLSLPDCEMVIFFNFLIFENVFCLLTWSHKVVMGLKVGNPFMEVGAMVLAKLKFRLVYLA